MMPETIKSKPVNYVCSACARAAGGAWPPGHCATVSVSECGACGKLRGTCSVDDWNWPGGKPRGWQGGGRD